MLTSAIAGIEIEDIMRELAALEGPKMRVVNEMVRRREEVRG
jgi:hypothetical protein